MKVKEKRGLAPKPMYPKTIKDHGLFGKILKQHMMINENWTPDSITTEFRKMTELLKKYNQFSAKERTINQKKLIKIYYSLKKQCRDGYANVKSIRAGNPQQLRTILSNHCEMQRLYQKMPLHLAVENINQRTFVMRKERDRLRTRLSQLTINYQEQALQKARLENRICFENEFRLDEEFIIDNLQKRLEDSKTRLKAIMTINSTYKKIIKILRHDEIFYFPILRSLDADVEDQSQFIKHVLHLGSPVIQRFSELSDEYVDVNDKAQKSNHKRLSDCAYYRKFKPETKERRSQHDHAKIINYVRENASMLQLKAQFEEIEQVIKKIKIATISSSEKDIYSRIKSQVNNNYKLASTIENDMLGHVVYEAKMKCASVLQEVLINNLTDDSISRSSKIKELKEAIKGEDDFEGKTLAIIKNNANLFVILRFFLWNLFEIMRHVAPKRAPVIKYPVDYLNLPLLKFDMLTMKVYPPEAFEQNIEKLFKEVHSKLKRLVKVYEWNLNDDTVINLKEQYCREMSDAIDNDARSVPEPRFNMEQDMDLMEEVRAYKSVPSRNNIKTSSARLVEKHTKIID